MFAICTGAMFSSGFFLLPGLAADQTGPSVPLAYLGAGVLVLPALLSLAELSSAMPRAGGPYHFLARGLGPLSGTIGALAKYLQLLFKGAFAFVGVGAYLSFVTAVPIRPVAIGLVVVFTLVNLLGTGQTARTEIALVAVLLVLLVYLVVAGGIEVLANPPAIDRLQPVFAFGVEGFLSAIALVFVSYAGVGQVASVSEEIRNPTRSIPQGMLGALGTATFFYVLGTAIMIALVPPDTLRDDPTPVATVVGQFTVLPLPSALVVVAALAAFVSTGNAAILSASRYPLAMARDDLLWRRFAHLDRRGVPQVAVLMTGALLIALIAIFDLEGIAKLASAFLLLVFAGMCLVLLVFRASGIAEYAPGFRAPLYPWLQWGGIAIYLVLIVESGPQALGLIVALLVGGGVWYRSVVRHRVTRAAAIDHLFARLARRHGAGRIAPGPGLTQLAAHPLDALVDRAIVLDLDTATDLDEVVRAAADAIADRVGGQRQILARNLKQAVRPWASPVDAGIALSPVLLQGIEQPEMVLVRVAHGIEVDGQRLRGVVVVVDDQRTSGRLLEVVSELTALLHERGVGRDWQQAADARALRQVLARDVESLTVELDARRRELIDTPIRDLNLPDGSLVALIRRDGVTLVPNGQERLRVGDQVTFLAKGDAFRALAERLG